MLLIARWVDPLHDLRERSAHGRSLLDWWEHPLLLIKLVRVFVGIIILIIDQSLSGAVL